MLFRKLGRGTGLGLFQFFFELLLLRRVWGACRVRVDTPRQGSHQSSSLTQLATVVSPQLEYGSTVSYGTVPVQPQNVRTRNVPSRVTVRIFAPYIVCFLRTAVYVNLLRISAWYQIGEQGDY